VYDYPYIWQTINDTTAMNIALFHGHYDQRHLQYVIDQMQSLGAPTIKAVWMPCYNHWVALEGTHRILAAQQLGLEPIIDEVDYSDDIIISDSGDEYVISNICHESYASKVITINA
jgi:hypothetical protein